MDGIVEPVRTRVTGDLVPLGVEEFDEPAPVSLGPVEGHVRLLGELPDVPSELRDRRDTAQKATGGSPHAGRVQ